MKRIPGNQTCCWLLLLCAGCAQTITVSVTGANQADSPIPSHATYAVLPTKDVEKNPAFLGYARLVANNMDARNYTQTSEQTAQLGILLDYQTIGGGTGDVARSSTIGFGMGGSGSRNYGMAAGSSTGAADVTIITVSDTIHRPSGACRKRERRGTSVWFK